MLDSEFAKPCKNCVFSASGSPYTLVDELFVFNNKGLSTFAKQPKDVSFASFRFYSSYIYAVRDCIWITLLILRFEGAESLREMLEKAKVYIPQKKWRETPIALKATAGLRLLDEEDSKALLDSVKTNLRTLLQSFNYLLQV